MWDGIGWGLVGRAKGAGCDWVMLCGRGLSMGDAEWAWLNTGGAWPQYKGRACDRIIIEWVWPMIWGRGLNKIGRGHIWVSVWWAGLRVEGVDCDWVGPGGRGLW